MFRWFAGFPASTLGLCSLSWLLMAAPCLKGADRALPDANDLAEWEVKGAVEADASKEHTAGKPSIKLGPGGKATLQLADGDAFAGRVTMWVAESGGTRAEEGKKVPGPRWGVKQPDNVAVAGAVMFAPYLSGNKKYSVSESDGKLWYTSHYVGKPDRTEDWVEWVFEFSPDAGLSVSANGVPVGAYKAAASKFKEGISDLVLLGDEADQATEQITAWIADIKVEPAEKP